MCGTRGTRKSVGANALPKSSSGRGEVEKKSLSFCQAVLCGNEWDMKIQKNLIGCGSDTLHIFVTWRFDFQSTSRG